MVHRLIILTYLLAFIRNRHDCEGWASIVNNVLGRRQTLEKKAERLPLSALPPLALRFDVGFMCKRGEGQQLAHFDGC